MTSNRHPSIGWFLGLLIVLAIAGLTLLGLSYFNRPVPLASQAVLQAVHPMVDPGEKPQLAPGVRGKLVVPLGAAIGYDAADAPRSRVPERPDALPPLSWQPPPMPYKFLGKMTEGDETVVLLYGDGRTLPVRGVGPLDDDYVVEVIQESYLVVRHVSLAQSQVIQFASKDAASDAGWTAENSAQD